MGGGSIRPDAASSAGTHLHQRQRTDQMSITLSDTRSIEISLLLLLQIPVLPSSFVSLFDSTPGPNGNSSNSRAEARQWLLKHSSGDISSAEQMAFRAWLESSAENQRAFDDLQLMWTELDQVSDQVLAQHGDIPASRPTRLWAVAASVLVTALFAGLLWQSPRTGDFPI